MKNSIFVKFIALTLCALSLAAAALGGLGAVGVELGGLHETTPEQEAETQLEHRAYALAMNSIQRYAAEAYSNIPAEELPRIYDNYYDYAYYGNFSYEIRDGSGRLVNAQNNPGEAADGRSFTLSARYPVALTKTTLPIYRESSHGEYSGTDDTAYESLGAYENRTVVTITDGVEVYESPDRNSDLVDILDEGTRLLIAEELLVDGILWGRYHKGWVELDYLAILDQEITEPTGPSTETEVPVTQPEEPGVPTPMTTEEGELATVVAHFLNVRPEPAPAGDITAQLTRGTQVRIYERREAHGAPWGRIDQGWINLNYVAIGNFTQQVPAPEGIEEMGEPLSHSEASFISGDYEYIYELAYYQSPEFEITLWLDESEVYSDIQLLQELYTWRDYFIPVLLISLALFAMSFVYLCASAGRRPDGSIRPSGLNRLPLDLYFLGAGAICAACGAAMVFVVDRGGFDTVFFRTVLGLGALGIALPLVGFCFCFAAQVKVPGRYWWHHSLTGWLTDWLLRLLARGMLALRALGRGCKALLRMLPVVWQWLAVAVGIPLLGAAFFFLCLCSYDFGAFFFFCLFLLCVAAFIGLVCYGAYAYGQLMKGVQFMAQGDLNHKVPTRYLHGTFLDFAERLNSLGGAARIAAQKQMKSERMKTELITNVSHDIKTPLTSIINFVDLLKKPHTEEEEQQYLDVLDRQSQRLKKLIDDLMEMSKASTGNLTVELGRVDAVEAVNQALGEFADKLDKVNLVPVFRHPEEPVTMRADGRLVWRVLSNVLNNAVKYALPDTRLYIDLNVMQGNAVLAIKNISRDQLNVDAEELMERFVRGDTSRNTEGSGLGLNIAKSLVELQQGQMHLMVDGDLFKVTLIFPLG